MENTDWDLEDLSNPKKFQDPLDVSGYENEFLINLLKTMIIIRTTEDKLAEERKKGVIPFSVFKANLCFSSRVVFSRQKRNVLDS